LPFAISEKDVIFLRPQQQQNDHFLLTINGQTFNSVLKYLLRPVEIFRNMKSNDELLMVKRADIGQMLDCTTSAVGAPFSERRSPSLDDVVCDMARFDDILEYVVEDVVPYESWMQRHDTVSLKTDLHLILKHMDAFFQSLDVTDIIEEEENVDYHAAAAAVNIDDFDSTDDDDDDAWMVESENEDD